MSRIGLSTKGDFPSQTSAGIGVLSAGANGSVVVADSAQSTGLAYTTVTTTGGLAINESSTEDVRPVSEIGAGNARGSRSLDLQMSRTLATQVGSGTRATLMGTVDCTVSGDRSSTFASDGCSIGAAAVMHAACDTYSSSSGSNFGVAIGSSSGTHSNETEFTVAATSSFSGSQATHTTVLASNNAATSSSSYCGMCGTDTATVSGMSNEYSYIEGSSTATIDDSDSCYIGASGRSAVVDSCTATAYVCHPDPATTDTLLSCTRTLAIGDVNATTVTDSVGIGSGLTLTTCDHVFAAQPIVGRTDTLTNVDHAVYFGCNASAESTDVAAYLGTDPTSTTTTGPLLLTLGYDWGCSDLVQTNISSTTPTITEFASQWVQLQANITIPAVSTWSTLVPNIRAGCTWPVYYNANGSRTVTGGTNVTVYGLSGSTSNNTDVMRRMVFHYASSTDGRVYFVNH